MKFRFFLSIVLHSILVSLLANCYYFVRSFPQGPYILIPVFLLVNTSAGLLVTNTHNTRFRLCLHGTVLLYAFYISLIVSTLCQIFLAVKLLPEEAMTFVWGLLLCIGVNFVIFWNGILCVYITSAQLGGKLRVVGLACGLIPIANLMVLFRIIRATTEECLYEFQKEQTHRSRSSQVLCATKYPILMVHGVFFRDTKWFSYWGRIPKELKANGARIFFGNHPSALSVADSAAVLKTRIDEILAETGAEKVNIIAHSKGGLDCRYAIAKLGIGPNVASLTTVNTPHRGCLFADYLLEKISSEIAEDVASTYNASLKKLGEDRTDFMAAVTDLTDARCKELDAEMPQPEGIYCQSIGSVLTRSSYGTFPLNFSYHLVKHFSGENDGLVSEDSFSWGHRYTLLRPTDNRGISHGDMIDLNRENIPGFDVREFYVQLVHDLKKKGF